ncbi:DUF1279 super [Emydomyces testavorans]|uniref:DUF1279 super n=1 Tax=Emydomyces testavorans TaxID=2070801 RepID=A0AAF0DC57_9EURO|nr:DUF1279 super [Emydomyces testavorans]
MPPLRPFTPSSIARAFRASAEHHHHSHSLRWPDASSRIWRPIQPPTIPRSSSRTTHTSSANLPIRTRSIPFSSNKRATIPPFSTSPSQAPRRFNSTPPAPSEPPTFSERMRKLSREYGWSALGVYLFLSVLDFPFCFAAVRLLGVERIGHYEHVVVESLKRVLPPIWGAGRGEPQNPGTGDVAIAAGDVERIAMDHDGVMETEGTTAEEGASIWTQLALAYAVHKSLIFLRVPLTAAVTPKVVKTLRRWGWDIGRRKPKRR